ncbi:MAG: ATP synthase subunit alpha [bacterium ADurb.Bin212]|nr:MAG: ATP synthase subunit alpha [bacterium ADurb.Bin212]
MSKFDDFLTTDISPKELGHKIPVKNPENSKLAQSLSKSMPQVEDKPYIIEVGEVVYIGDGVCKVSGLNNARIDDVLRVETSEGDVLVLVLGISEELVETVVLGDYFTVKKGNLVYSTQSRLGIPVSNEILGRIVSPIGKPLDGKGDIEADKQMNVERPAPPVFQRTPIVDQLKTGFVVTDSIIPIGRGQRELVTGDRKSGKTRLMIDIICNLADENVICVYVAIGAQKAKVKSIAQYLQKRNALAYTAIVMGSSDDPPSLNYLAPYAGCAVAEYFSDLGREAVVVYDDLSKHAKAYRQMSLLLKRSPGRDAYPGDIFYLHSRLLERAAKVDKEFGGGSITALPVSETQNGDISEYITTNLMSITDGHIYLDAQLMHDGILPAVNSGASVSRIGGSIQSKVLRRLGGVAGGQLARYNEVKSYETMNTELTEDTEREINRGKRILEFFNQPSNYCYSVSEECILLYVATSGMIDYIDMELVTQLKKELVDFYRENITKYAPMNDFLSSTGKVEDKDTSFLEQFISDFVSNAQTKAAAALKESLDKIQNKNQPPKEPTQEVNQQTDNKNEKKE